MSLKYLESESIYIIRECVAKAANPVLLYSIGKDSSVLLHLARKAFYPAPLPFPLLHIDTTWKFREMIEFRDRQTAKLGVEMLVYTHADKVTPFSHGASEYTRIMKTEALKQALEKYGFDAALGGARRDEEKSRAKEHVFSFRDKNHRWDPKNQRSEVWGLYNARVAEGESVRVFPLSNWSELDIWQYIQEENIDVVPLYFSRERDVVERAGKWIMVDDGRFPLEDGEEPVRRTIRFRTLGCYPLTAAIESDADTLEKIVGEMQRTSVSERQGRLIDFDSPFSMEQKKREGYF